jgi:hypothetical protein
MIGVLPGLHRATYCLGGHCPAYGNLRLRRSTTIPLRMSDCQCALVMLRCGTSVARSRLRLAVGPMAVVRLTGMSGPLDNEIAAFIPPG